MQELVFVGVDGGATKCTVRVEDAAGNLLGRESGGSANIRLSVANAWASINNALTIILNQLGITLTDTRYEWHAGMGLAGCEVITAYNEFMRQSHAFKTLTVVSDAHAACLGAHGGADGAIIIAGTGVIGYQINRGQIHKVSGWGFPHDDIGSGAWIGQQAVMLTLQALDGRLQTCPLAEAVFVKFDNDDMKLMQWLDQANSTAYAALAPLVIQLAEGGDLMAGSILQRAALAIDCVGATLAAKAAPDALPCALVGGVAPFLTPLLSAKLTERLYPPQAPADQGAVALIRRKYYD